jgi:hypothetical protein
MFCAGHKIAGMGLVEPPQLLAPPVDSDETERRGRRPWCGDEAAPTVLGMVAP